jgi:hypothetical protein
MLKEVKRAVIAIITGFICAHVAAGMGGVRESLVKEGNERTRPALTGSITTDFFSISAPQMMQLLSRRSVDLQDPTNVGDRKSPVLAAVLSGVVPGAGEYYSHSYLKSGAFFAAEVVSWILYSSYDRRGDRATGEFQTYADGGWSVVKYATFAQTLTPAGETYNWKIPGREDQPPWEQVNWTELNRMERAIGGFFSHTLPMRGDQQYYELIGKYPQYNPGWDDGEGPISETNISPHFRSYSLMRGYANNLYSKASTALLVAVVNHVLSAADAAWSATRYNSVHLEAGMNMRRTPLGVETVPTATVTVRW